MYLPMDADRLISENDFNFFGFAPRYRSRFHSATRPLAISILNLNKIENNLNIILGI
jgi:hypothetical protein